MTRNQNLNIKITVVGDGDTGKTCMLIVYKDKKYKDEYIPTVFDSYSMNIDVHGETYTMVLNDTAGQEEFDKLRPLAYSGTHVFIVCFSVDNRTSYENVLNKWIPELKHHRPTARIILVGTKVDLRRLSSDKVSPELGEQLRRKIKAELYLECSSKLMQGIDTVFEEAIKCHVLKPTKKPVNNLCCIL